MTWWISVLVWGGVAQGATWTYRAPVPTEAPADGRGFRLCLALPAHLDMETATHRAGSISLTCSSTEQGSQLCFEVGEPWPDRWEALTCKGSTRVALRFVPAFDPNDAVLDGVTIAGEVDELAASFALPPGAWPDQSYEGSRSTTCRVQEGRLWVWREGRSRRKGLCEIRERDGTAHRFYVRVGRVR